MSCCKVNSSYKKYIKRNFDVINAFNEFKRYLQYCYAENIQAIFLLQLVLSETYEYYVIFMLFQRDIGIPINSMF